MKMTKPMRCDQCRRNLDLGVDVIKMEKCVVGPRGIVPLGEVQLFCCEECLACFFHNGSLQDIPPRIP